ncbi:MAG: hypothetical protein ACRD5E_08145 [Nitrososphaeraceae archaeon]
MLSVGPTIPIINDLEDFLVRIVFRLFLDKPVLDINVANKVERGLLGIAVANQTLGNDMFNKTYVYLFYTQSTEDGNDV